MNDRKRLFHCGNHCPFTGNQLHFRKLWFRQTLNYFCFPVQYKDIFKHLSNTYDENFGKNSERLKAYETPCPSLNPFVPNAPFVYPLKISENRKVFWCFHEAEKGCVGSEWVNLTRKMKQPIFLTPFYAMRLLHANTRSTVRWEICSKLTTKTPKQSHSGVFIVNFEQITHLSSVFVMLTLNR